MFLFSIFRKKKHWEIKLVLFITFIIKYNWLYFCRNGIGGQQHGGNFRGFQKILDVSWEPRLCTKNDTSVRQHSDGYSSRHSERLTHQRFLLFRISLRSMVCCITYFISLCFLRNAFREWHSQRLALPSSADDAWILPSIVQFPDVGGSASQHHPTTSGSLNSGYYSDSGGGSFIWLHWDPRRCILQCKPKRNSVCK